MKSSFRTIENWKSAIMDLPDNSFYELLRAVFGNIKTPFNKQRLFEDLFTLLSRNEIRKTISAYIDEGDHKIIAALALLNNPVQEKLESFFAGEFSASELHGIVINLEERLIIYRFREKGILRLSLNPVLEKILSPFIDDPGILFPFEKNQKEDKETDEYLSTVYIPEARQMAALFSFILNEEELFKQEGGGNAFGGIRKKVLDEGKKIFPYLDLDLAVNTALRLGLVQSDGIRLAADRKKISSYCGLSYETRQDYWAAAVYLCLEENIVPDQGSQERFSELFSRSSRNRLRNTAGFFRRVKSIIKPGKLYPETTLRRLTELLDTEDEKPSWGSALFDERLKLLFEPFLTALEKTGILIKASPPQDLQGSFFKAGPSGNARKEAESKENPEGPVIVMDTAFSFVLYPEISLDDALALVYFCTVKDSSASLLISRESAVRGFDQGIGAADILSLLDRLSGKRIDNNLGWALKEWESRYAEVSLNQGVILTLAEDRRYLAEAGPISSLIQRTLAPGVYLLSSGDRSGAAQALRRAGVDIIAQPPLGSPDLGYMGYEGPEAIRGPANFFPSLAEPEIDEGLLSVMGTPKGNSPLINPEEAESSKRKFREKLEKMKLTKPERDELGARIERCLVLTEAQLEGSSVRYEKLEARGLDYAGKTSIAKQAVENTYLLEVFWPGPRGETNQSTGYAQAMEKKGSESILVLKEPDTGNTVRVPGNTVRVPLEKISLIRRIKQSIFKE